MVLYISEGFLEVNRPEGMITGQDIPLSGTGSDTSWLQQVYIRNIS